MTNSALLPSTPRRRALIDRLRRFALGRRLALAVTTLGLAAGVGAPAAFASAPTTYCVHYSGYSCPSGATDEGADLQSALNAASGQPASSGSPNVIDIGPGSYGSGTGEFSYASANPLRIVGAGADTTTLTGTGPTDVLSLGNTDTAETVSVSDLAISVQTQNGTGLALTGGSADHITVASQQTGVVGVALDGATLSSSVISDANAETAVETQGQPSALGDDTLQADSYGVLAEAQTTIHRITAEGADYGVFASSAPVSIDDSLVKSACALASDDGGINALNDTLVGTTGAHVGVISYAATSSASYIQVQNSIIYAFPYSFETAGQSGGLAEINASTDNYDGLSYGSDITQSQSIGSDPGFVDALDGDYHLAFNSSLIDASAVESAGANNSSTDLDGNPRVVVDGNASTPVDLGAYEYQHRAPVAQATASPSSGNPGTVFSFDSAGSHDPDDGDYLSYSWSFDDGASASGSTASHGFSTPGSHTATLTVTDSSGLTSTATATVSVIAPPTGVASVPGWEPRDRNRRPGRHRGHRRQPGDGRRGGRRRRSRQSGADRKGDDPDIAPEHPRQEHQGHAVLREGSAVLGDQSDRHHDGAPSPGHDRRTAVEPAPRSDPDAHADPEPQRPYPPGINWQARDHDHSPPRRRAGVQVHHRAHHRDSVIARRAREPEEGPCPESSPVMAPLSAGGTLALGRSVLSRSRC